MVSRIDFPEEEGVGGEEGDGSDPGGGEPVVSSAS